MSAYGIQGVLVKTDRQVINEDRSEDIHCNTKWQIITLKLTNVTARTLTMGLLRRIHHPHSDSNSMVHEISNINTGVIWSQPSAVLGWYHATRFSHRLHPSKRREQLPTSVQRCPWHTCWDLLCGPRCCDASWSHTGFCFIYQNC